jgi:type IV pilus assembly protein PilV
MNPTIVRSHARLAQRGVTLLEVLVTVLILAFGLIGLVGLQTKVQAAQADAYQRAQAVLLVEDMANRISANRVNAASYVTTTPLGTGDSQPTSCTGLAGAALDACEWSKELRGAAEQSAGGSVGAMIGARGCITKVAANPPVYQVTVAWQAMTSLAAPSLSCGSGSYASETRRRAIGALVTVAKLS